MNPNNGSKQLSIFKDNNFTYLYTKVEKVVTALYMITNFMSVNEPLKWQIRETSLKLLDAVMSLNKASLSGREIVVRELSGYLFQVRSLFNIAYKSGFISVMNFSIVDRELSGLTDFLIEYDSNKLSIESPLFNKTFFTEQVQKGQVKRQVNPIKDSLVYGNNGSGVNKGQSENRHVSVVENSDRRQKIMNILRDKKEVSIKDIATIITDCSEKTLQRELIAMVDSGLIIKEGERRWSKYSLKT